jgi:CheY-like chemotaxis protein
MTEKTVKAPVILLVEDDLEDQNLAKRAMRGSKLLNNLFIVDDGEAALEYLRRHGDFSDPDDSPRPDLILLDLNMPKIDGRSVLAEIKSDPKLRQIAVIVLTTSIREEDIKLSYDLGVNSYITKPARMESFVKVVRDLEHYWFELAALPPELG